MYETNLQNQEAAGVFGFAGLFYSNNNSSFMFSGFVFQSFL